MLLLLFNEAFLYSNSSTLNCDIDGTRGRHVKNKWGVASVLPRRETVMAKRATMVVIERRYLVLVFLCVLTGTLDLAFVRIGVSPQVRGVFS